MGVIRMSLPALFMKMLFQIFGRPYLLSYNVTYSVYNGYFIIITAYSQFCHRPGIPVALFQADSFGAVLPALWRSLLLNAKTSQPIFRRPHPPMSDDTVPSLKKTIL